MIDVVYSIGYSGFSLDDFVSTLQSNKISLLVDVRSQPYSKYFSDYNKENIEKKLKSIGIRYRNFADEFGARQDNPEYYSSEGYLDFELFAKSKSFLSGYNRLINSMKQGYCFALMCAEKDPINCHRSILVSRAFHEAGYKVVHLLPNNVTMTQDEIENRLMKKYFPYKYQVTLFDEGLSEDEYVNQIYRKRNAEIGYSIEEEKN